jgi:mRNA turnover protein 4
MAKSKRNRVVPLTKVNKKDKVSSIKKAALVKSIETHLQDSEYCYVFRYKNMTTVPMQELRNYWNTSKFMIGKNKVLQVALGKSEDEEPKLNSHKLAGYLKGNCGLFFSDKDHDLVLE